MKTIILSLSMILASSSLLAGNSYLNLKCTDEKNQIDFTVLSGKYVSVVYLMGKAWTGNQLNAGHEGGPLYIQTVNNDAYNLIIEGGELGKAKGQALVGKTSFALTIFNFMPEDDGSMAFDLSINGTCEGYMEIDPNEGMGL